MLFSAGCSDDFFDINDNPNAPTTESVGPALILPRVQHSTAARMATSYMFAGHWMGYWARSGTFGQSLPLENYDITSTYETDEWTGWYDILMDVDIMENKAEASGETFYVAVAKLYKAIGFMYLVDQYNNVPYTEAFNVAEHILPKYDKGQDIYNSLLAELDAANDMMAAANVTTEMENADAVFSGDKAMWRKLINSQRLKLILRQSQVPGFNGKAEVDKIVADGGGFLTSGETAAVNVAYAQTEGKQNPFWNAYKQTVSGSSADDFNRANNFVLNTMKSSNDIRYQYFFARAAEPTGNPPLEWRGFEFGLFESTSPSASQSSSVAGPGLAKSATQPQWFFTSVESMFLQAEAIQRGWLAGDPRAAYEAAVTESFVWLGVPNAVATANAYLAQSLPIVDWDAEDNATPADKIELIVTQKYLAMVGINNFEAWADYRRLGVPANVPLSQNVSRSGRVIPKRLMYPQAEFNYNAANVNAEGPINHQTATVFWDR